MKKYIFDKDVYILESINEEWATFDDIILDIKRYKDPMSWVNICHNRELTFIKNKDGLIGTYAINKNWCRIEED